MTHVIGIDLGTTSSRVAVLHNGSPVIIENSEGEGTTPSHVAVTVEGRRLVGEAAHRYALQAPESVAFAVKRLTGRRYSDPVVQQMARFVPYRIVEADNGEAWVELNRRRFSPSQLSASTLLKMKQTAEDFLGEPITAAVVTVPANFDDSQRQATKDAGRIAGLDIVRIITEPVAAALSYGFGRSSFVQTIAVYDLGGGTFDVSVLEIGDGVFEVKSTRGDMFLGGEDFDYAIVEYIAHRFKKTHGVDLLANPLALQRLKQASEAAKIDLSSNNAARIDLPFIDFDGGASQHLEAVITRREIDALLSPFVDRTIAVCDQALKASGLKAADMDAIVLVGGSTRIPLVRKAIENYFGKAPFGGLRREDAVALGAAIQGAVLYGKQEQTLLLDVTPLSLGVETQAGVFTHLIDRDTSIPTKKSQVFSTAEDDQPAVTIKIFQGQSDMAADNKPLGQFDLVNIPLAPRGIPQIMVTFDIDANSILYVHTRLVDKSDNSDEIDEQCRLTFDPKHQSTSYVSATWEIDASFRVRAFGEFSEIQIAQMLQETRFAEISSKELTRPAQIDMTPPARKRELPAEPPPSSVSAFSGDQARSLAKPRIFISYAHEDEGFVKNIEKVFSSLVRVGHVELWVDRHIKSGDEWEASIFSALEVSNVVILLLSNDFLGSEFIAAKELPAIFAEKERRRLTLVPIIVRPCPFELHNDLVKFQLFNKPERPWSSMNTWEFEADLVRLTREVCAALV